MISIRVDDAGLANALRLSPDTHARARRDWAARGAILTRNTMLQVIRARQRGGTGYLRKTIAYDIRPAGFSVYPTAAYAIFVDQPTRPHLIFPRRRKALAFARTGSRPGRTTAGHVKSKFTFGGRTTTTGPVIVKAVRHPGTRGMFFEQATLDAIREPLAQDLERTLEEARQRSGIP